MTSLRRWARRLIVWPLTALVGVLVASMLANVITQPPETLAAPDGRDVQVGGVRVHYREWGREGPTVLLVHGWGEHTAVWQPVAERLAADHRVVAFDMAGFGYTEYTGRYDLDSQVALLDGLIAALKLDKPVVVGHSLGAAVVAAQALRHPDHISGVILADGDALAIPGRNGVPAWVTRVPLVTTAYRIGTRWGWVGRSIIRSQCGSQCKHVTPGMPEVWLRPLRQRAAERAEWQMAQAPILHLTPAELQRIRAPRGIIWGAEDARSGGSLDQTRANLGHPPEVLIAGAGHLSMVADADVFAAGIRALERTMR